MINSSRSPKTIRIATAVFFFISGFGYTTWASRIPSIQRDLHLNEAQLGTALFALPVGLLTTMPLTARLLRSYSSSRIMLLGALYFSLMLGLLGYAVQYWQFILVLFCFGSSRNLLNVSMNTDGVNVQGLYKKSIITTFHAIWSCAGFAGAALGYFMVANHVITTGHLLSVSTTLVVLSVCFAPFTIKQQPFRSEKKPIFSLPDKTLVSLALICFSSMACENIMYDWSGIYMDKAVHSTHTTATAAFVIFMTTLTISRFAGDKVIGYCGVKQLIQYSGAFIVTGFLLAVLFPYVPTTIIGFGFVGIGTSCIVPLCFSEAGKSTTMAKGPAIAAVSTVGYFGFLVVPPMVGFVAQALNLRWSFAIITMLGAVIVWMASKIKINNAELVTESI